MSAEKAKLRRMARDVRDKLSPKARMTASAAICSHILASPLLQNCRILLCYAPIGSEADVLTVAKAALAEGKIVGFPICNGAEMEFYAVTSLDELCKADAFGIPIPDATKSPRITPDHDTLMLLPGLALDKSGNRIGYGKGYYDRYLHRASPAPVTLGVTYAATLFESIPSEKNDFPVVFLATEDGIIRNNK